ncbi:hypothetical protein LCGC14_2666540, partial [marine sediment metagenome]
MGGTGNRQGKDGPFAGGVTSPTPYKERIMRTMIVSL